LFSNSLFSKKEVIDQRRFMQNGWKRGPPE